jgi:hypothetical protein
MAEHQVRRLPVLNRGKRLADLGRTGIKAAKKALVGVSEPTDQVCR